MFVVSHVSVYYLVYIRVSWQKSVAVFIDLHLLLESTIPKGKRVKSTSKTIICNIHDSSIGKVRNSSPLHLHYGRRLLKSLASQSALSTEWKLDGSFLHIQRGRSIMKLFVGNRCFCECYDFVNFPIIAVLFVTESQW